MSYTTGNISPTYAELDAGKFIPIIYSTQVIQHVMSSLVAGANVNIQYQSDLRFGHTVEIPVMSEVTATEVTPGSDHARVEAVGTAVSITVDQWYAAQIETSDYNDIQNKPDYLAEAAKSCGYAVAKIIDTGICALFDNLGGESSSAYGSDGQTLTDDIILALMQYLDTADTPDEGQRVIIGDASSKVDLLKIDKFVRNDYVRNPVVATGQFGNIYNMKFFTTQNLGDASLGHYGVMMHKDAIGLVIQRNPRSVRFEIPQNFITRYRTDAIWGQAVIRQYYGKPFYTRAKA